MQRSGGGAVFGESNVNSRRPLIPVVLPLKLIRHFAAFCSKMNALEIKNRQEHIVTAIAQTIRKPWRYAVVDVEIDVIDGDRTENSIALSYNKRFLRLVSRDIDLPNDHFDWFVLLRDRMTEFDNSSWGSCKVVLDNRGFYQFDFSYEPPPRLNGIYDDATMLTSFDPRHFLKRRSKWKNGAEQCRAPKDGSRRF